MLVSRTNLFLFEQQNIFPGAGQQTGVGDIEEADLNVTG